MWILIFSSGIVVEIQTPVIYLLVSVCIILSIKSEILEILQMLSAIYLISLPLNHLSSHYFTLTWWNLDVNYTFPFVILIYFIFGILKWSSCHKKNIHTITFPKSDILFLTLILLLVHVLGNYIILKYKYGYGYEHNTLLIGRISLYFLLMIWLGPLFSDSNLRKHFGVSSVVVSIMLFIYN